MEIRHAIVKAWDAGTYTADIQITGSLSLYLAGVPVARNIAGAEMIAGRQCAVWFHDGTTESAVVIAVWT